MRIWMKNTSGRPDAVLTMAFIGFLVILFKIVLSNVSFTFGDLAFNCGSVDAAIVGALLTPTLGAYVARRLTDKKYGVDDTQLEAVASVRTPNRRR